MKVRSKSAKLVPTIVAVGVCVFALAQGAPAQPAVDPDARKVLAATSSYLSGLKSFSVEYTSVDEVVTPEGQKLQFLHSGEIIVQRPNKLYATRTGAAGTTEVVLDGKELAAYRKTSNAYMQLDVSSIDDAIVAVHNIGFDAPGADLLASKPLDESTTDITSGDHIGMTFIDGIEVHQLAFRGSDVDWQLWVTAGDKPLPLRYVITTKGVPGSPEYTLQLRNWNTAPQIDAAKFTFEAPQGAKKVDPSAVTVNAIGDLTVKGE